jgi:hypothetical protein
MYVVAFLESHLAALGGLRLEAKCPDRESLSNS